MPTSLVMMGLGAFRFGLNRASYQTFRRSAAFRHEEVQRIGRAPARQFTGPGSEEVTLQGVVYPHFRGGLRQVDLMRMEARSGLPMMLVDGLGWVWDRWVILDVEETKSAFLSDGAPRKIEFSVTLGAYGSDLA